MREKLFLRRVCFRIIGRQVLGLWPLIFACLAQLEPYHSRLSRVQRPKTKVQRPKKASPAQLIESCRRCWKRVLDEKYALRLVCAALRRWRRASDSYKAARSG